jgi:hypothetical protein
MEQQRPGAIYPHQIFPLPSDQWAVNGSDGGLSGSNTIRLGRMHSSPYLQAEIYGGKRTADLLAWILEEGASRDYLGSHDRAYLARLNQIDDGVTALTRICHGARLDNHTVW